MLLFEIQTYYSEQLKQHHDGHCNLIAMTRSHLSPVTKPLLKFARCRLAYSVRMATQAAAQAQNAIFVVRMCIWTGVLSISCVDLIAQTRNLHSGNAQRQLVA